MTAVESVVRWIDFALAEAMSNSACISPYDPSYPLACGWYRGRHSSLDEVKQDLTDVDEPLSDLDRLRRAMELTEMTVHLMQNAQPDATLKQTDPEQYGKWLGRFSAMKDALQCFSLHSVCS